MGERRTMKSNQTNFITLSVLCCFILIFAYYSAFIWSRDYDIFSNTTEQDYPKQLAGVDLPGQTLNSKHATFRDAVYPEFNATKLDLKGTIKMYPELNATKLDLNGTIKAKLDLNGTIKAEPNLSPESKQMPVANFLASLLRAPLKSSNSISLMSSLAKRGILKPKKRSRNLEFIKKSDQKISKKPTESLLRIKKNSDRKHDENYSSTEINKERRLEFDKHRNTWTLWRKNPKCKQHKTQFAKSHSLPPCALTSFPGSGNTWVRYLIEASTGVFTGSDYADALLVSSGYLGEFEPLKAGTTIVQKTHTYGRDVINNFQERAILLIRNPYRAILAFHNYMYAAHKLYAPMLSYRRKDWLTFVHFEAKKWLETFNNWVKYSKNLLVVHFEELCEDPIQQLRIINAFLGVPIAEDRLKCIQNEKPGQFKRRKEHFPENMIIFPGELRNKLDRAIDYLDFLLRNRGHTAPPLHLYEFYNGTSSDKLTFVPCLEGESTVDCDERIDKMNFATSDFFTPDEKYDATQKSNLQHVLESSEENSSAADKSINGGADTPDHDPSIDKQTPNEQYSSLKKMEFDSETMGLIFKSLQSVTDDPVQMLLNRDNGSYIRQPLDMAEDSYSQVNALITDFVSISNVSITHNLT